MRKNYKLSFYIVTFMFWGAMYSHVSVLSGYAEYLKASVQMIGIITGSYGFVQFLLRLPLGILSDRIKKRRVFITGAMVSSFAAGIVMCLVPTPTGLLIGRILCGITACAYVQITVLFTSYYEENEMSKAIGIMVALMYLSQMISMVIGGIATDKFGISSAFFLTSVYALIGIIVSFFIYDKPIDKKQMKMSELKSIITNRWLIAASILAILCQAIALANSWSFVPLAAYRAGASGTMQSVITTAFTFFGMLSALSSGKLSKIFGEKKVLAAGFLLQTLSSVIITLASSVLGLITGQIFSGIGLGLVFSLLMSVSLKTIPNQQRGSAIGLYQALFAMGMFLGPFIFGSFAEKYPLNYGFIATAILAFLGFILVFVVFKDSDKFESITG